MIGAMIGRYRVLSKLGEGGMGSVWLAEDPVLGRTVALKVLPEGGAHSVEARERLLREARAACRLHHPGIATVYEAGDEAGRIYLAFEHVDGETVAERVTRAGPLSVEEAFHIARQVAEALAHAHGKGILHRDVTSGNVMIDRSGRAKLVDFGLALPEGETRVTRPASTPGTIGYVAPEVVKGERGDRRADLYGLGVVLYEMLTGRLPFERDRAEAVLYAVVHEEPESPRRHRADVPDEVEAVIRRALAKDPEERFADASELIEAMNGGAEADRRTPPSRRLRRVVLVTAPALALAALLYWWSRPDSRFDSIAVLPLELVGPNAEESAYLATGLADALVTRLGRVSGLRVAPWVTSRRYPPDAFPLPDIGEELNVESLVVGAFREEGGELHIDLKLVEAGTGEDRWSEKFEDTRSGLLELQQEITLAVVRSVRGDLTPEEEEALVRRPTDRADAYDHYLRGAAALRAGPYTGSEEALGQFETALAIDPRLAEAWVGVGAVLGDRYAYGRGDDDSLKSAKEAFRRALDIDPEMIPALGGLMQVAWYRGPNEECLRLARNVRERSSAEGRASVGALLTQATGFVMGGLSQEAVPLLLVANQLDPANQASRFWLVIARASGEEPATAIPDGEEYLRTFGEDPMIHFFIGAAERCRGNREAALAHYERSLELFGDNANAHVHGTAALLYRELGKERSARAVAEDGIRQLESRLRQSGENRLLETGLIRLYAIAGDTTQVLALGPELREADGSHMLQFFLPFAYCEIGEKETANRILLEHLKRLRRVHAPPSSPEEHPAGNDVVFMSYWLHRCGSGLAGAGFEADAIPALRDLPAYADLVEALQKEQERRRALYGS